MKFTLHSFAPLVLIILSFATQLHAQSQSAFVDGAKKEGKLVWYTSMAVDTSKPLLDAFVERVSVHQSRNWFAWAKNNW